MAPALLTTLPARISLRSLKWSLLLMSLLSFLSTNVIKCVNWMYFYEYEPIYRQDFHFTLQEHSNFLTFFLLIQQAEKEDKVLALSLEDEHLLYGDIIRQEFLDIYNNLTLKTIMAFRWVTEFCPSARHIMKTDTDVFVNSAPPSMGFSRQEYWSGVPLPYRLVGNYSYRGFYQKTLISYQEYLFKVFPPYCSGLPYIMSRDLVLIIYEMMSHVKPIKFEDVYVGTCLNLLKVDIYIPEDTNLFFLYRIHLDVCQLRRVIAAHGFSSKEIITF
ncbi:hypothetical protein JEQ12_017538 [Ovis aries]|uniref:Hexosyltransferase n=1 Tax=Ovis aries TaxID=9940 RepID=A0A836A229_SHEEP|nr:hypothetical protein JEQ12_017538 [Ovis aries]